MLHSSPESSASARSPGRRVVGLRAILAISSALAGAAVASLLVAGHGGAAPTTPAPVQQMYDGAAHSPRYDALNNLAIQAFKQSIPSVQAKSVEAGIFIEHEEVSSEKSPITQVTVRSRRGDVRIIPNPGPEVYVVTGKFVIAANTARAREFAKRLRYDLKQDGSQVTAAIAQPAGHPGDVYAHQVVCAVVAPDNVKVVVNSGGNQ